MPTNTHFLFKIKAVSSEQLNKWLNLQTSLTDKLEQITGNANIKLIAQNWVNTDWWSKNLLQIQDEQVFQREIIMKSHEVPYWYARSIIPKSCYDLDPAFFCRLEQESIKNLIFAGEQVHRVQIINYPIDRQCLEYYWIEKNLGPMGEILWARLSEYSFVQKESFYLLEIMLPELEQLEIPN